MQALVSSAVTLATELLREAAQAKPTKNAHPSLCIVDTSDDCDGSGHSATIFKDDEYCLEISLTINLVPYLCDAELFMRNDVRSIS
jgi:hypothetical protein